MIKAFLRIVLLLFIVIAGFIAFMLTPMGLKLTVDIVQPHIPGKLSYKKISGVLIGPITLDDIHYTNKTESIQIKKLTINWEPLSLFKKELRISTLVVDNPTITSNNPAPSLTFNDATQYINTIITTLKKNALPFYVVINHADVKNLHFIDTHNHTQFQVHTLHLEAALTNAQWHTVFFAQLEKPMPYRIHFTIEGKPTDYTVQASLEGDQTNWALSGQGNQNTLTLHTDKTKLFNGTLNATVNIQWSNALTWKGKIESQKINLSTFNPAWTNHFSCILTSVGSTHDALTTQNQFDISSPNETIHITANYNKTWDMKWAVEIHHLSNWVNTLSGTLASHGELQGDLNNPTVNATLNTTVKDNDNKPITTNITLSGNLKKQLIDATLTRKKQTAHLALQGQYDHEQWLVTVTHFGIHAMTAHPWQLEKPATIIVKKEYLDATPICLTSSGTGRVCIQGSLIKSVLNASTKIDVTNFNWLNYWKRDVLIRQGKMQAEISVKGNIKKPTLQGTVNLSHTSITFPQLNVTLKNMTGTVGGNGDSLNLKLIGYTENQPITLDGTVDLSKTDFPIQATIKANNALIMNTDEYKLHATSNLSLSLKNKILSIQGSLIIPKAMIQPNDTQTTNTLPTNEIVYVGGDDTQKSPWGISVDVMLTIGNNVDLETQNVFINTAGINAILGGTLHLLKKPDRELFATGDVFVRKGTFTVYGQTLKFTPGSSLSYTNSLLGDPTLNLKATKMIASANNMGISNFTQNYLMVGIQIHGSVKNYKIKFISNRASLSEADILSYILLGYANNTNTPGNTDFLLRALAAVNITSQGLLGKQNIATQIQHGLGLSEMGVESETTVDAQGNPLNRQSAFVVGKHLTRKLYARYSIGLLDPVNVFQLRYLFNQHWALQTDSSVLGNGADVLYTFDRD